MTLRQFRFIKIGVAVVLAALVSIAVIQQNYVLALAAAVIAVLLSAGLKRQVKEVIEDERDFEVAGRAARLAMTIFSIAVSIAVFFLLFFRDQNPLFETVGSVLAYSVCALLIFYSLIFKYYDTGVAGRKKLIFMILAGGLILAFAVFGLRLFTGEDTWICRDGQWVKHGVPVAPMPSEPCK